MLLPASTTPPRIVPFQNLDVPLLSELPFIGVALFSHTSLTYTAFLIVPVVVYVLYRLPWGLAVRIAGENPVALEGQGINRLAPMFRTRPFSCCRILLSIVPMITVAHRAEYSRALLKPYRRGERL